MSPWQAQIHYTWSLSNCSWASHWTSKLYTFITTNFPTNTLVFQLACIRYFKTGPLQSKLYRLGQDTEIKGMKLSQWVICIIMDSWDITQENNGPDVSNSNSHEHGLRGRGWNIRYVFLSYVQFKKKIQLLTAWGKVLTKKVSYQKEVLIIKYIS